MKAIIFDCETTGLRLPSVMPLEKQPRIIELGAVVVIDRKLISQHNWLVYPECDISAEITKITGITNEDLKGQPTFREVLAEIEEIFSDTDFGIAHNAPFDVQMLHGELDLCSRTGFPWPREIICTIAEYSHIFGHRPKQTELYEHILGRPLAQTHRACDDAYALYEILAHDDFFNKIGA